MDESTSSEKECIELANAANNRMYGRHSESAAPMSPRGVEPATHPTLRDHGIEGWSLAVSCTGSTLPQLPRCVTATFDAVQVA